MIKKILFLFTALSHSIILLGSPSAEDSKKKPSFPSRDEVMQKFDTDKDGQLNDEERKKLRQGMASKRSVLPPLLAAKFDKDGDGKLSDEERADFRKEMASKGRKLPPHLMQKFDKDGDGQLSDEERAVAKQSWEDRKKSMLEKFDTDRDGKLSIKERQEVIKQAKLNFQKNSPAPDSKVGTEKLKKSKKKASGKKKNPAKGETKQDKKKGS